MGDLPRYKLICFTFGPQAGMFVYSFVIACSRMITVGDRYFSFVVLCYDE